MEIPKNIKDEIWEYCRINDIPNINEFIIKMVKNGFTSEKFGSRPWDKPAEVKEVEKIVEVEKIIEKEVIKEVIKEVEVVVEKEVFVTDDEANKELQKKLTGTTQLIKEMTLEFNTERKISAQMIDELYASTITLKDETYDLNEKVKKLEEELEIEKNKPKQEENDIYGEKKGFIGSNTSDLWNKKTK